MGEFDKGKIMAWSDIVAKYPNSIVGVTDYNQYQNPVTAKLMCVCKNEDEELKYAREFKKNGIKVSWIPTYESTEYSGIWQY